MLCNPVSTLCRIGARARRGHQTEPHVGKNIVPRHTLAEFIYLSEMELRVDIALIGGPAIPPRGFGIILSHFHTVEVSKSETVLRVGVALFSGKAIQPDRFGAVLSYALADEVHDA